MEKKSSSRRVDCSKEKELEVTSQKLVESADKKAKEAEKKTDVATMKTLLIESNALKKISGDNEDRCSKTRRDNKRSGKETKTCHLRRNSYLDQLSITKKCVVTCKIFLSMYFC